MKTWIALLPLLAACEELSEITPKVQFNTLRVQEIDFQEVSADFVFSVDNPNPIPVSLDRFSYDLELEQVQLIGGDEPEGLQLPAVGSAEVSIPATLVWSDVWDTIQAVRGEDEVDFGLAGDFGFDTNWGPLDLPYQTAGRFPALRTPKFRLGTLKVGKLDVLRGTATVALDVNIDNDHGSSLLFENLDYSLSLGGRTVGDGLIDSLGQIDGASDSTVSLPLTINLVSAGSAVAGILTNGGKLDAGLDANVDVDTPFGILPLAIDETGQVEVQR